jgi:thiamine-phosphate pyrophosphorylase
VTLPAIYPILDTITLAHRGLAVTLVAEAWLGGGAGILQFRHKGPWGRDVFQQAEHVAALCRGHKALFLVNDRADMAALLRAGLHVGQDDLAPADARRIIGAHAMLGFSTHNARQFAAAAAEPVDYLAFGPIFPTASKDNPDPVTGLHELRKCRAMTRKPLVAIGGITCENAPGVFEAGADTVAVIGGMLPEQCTAQSLRKRMEQWQQQIKTQAQAW